LRLRVESRRSFLGGLGAGLALLAPVRAALIGSYIVGCYTRP